MHAQRTIVTFLSLAASVLAGRRACNDQKTITVNGRNCKQQCGLDYSGSTYKTSTTSSYQDCIKLCATDSKCSVAQYSRKTGYCSLKSSTSKSTRSTSFDAVVCAKKPQRHSTTCTTSRATSRTSTSSSTTTSTSTVRSRSTLWSQTELTQSIQSTTTTTPTTTTTTTTTSSAPAPSHTIAAPRCDPATIDDDNGGCSNQCTCTPEAGTSDYYCGSSFSVPDTTCDESSLCAQGDFCSSEAAQCVSGTDPGDECTSTFNMFRK